MRERERDRLSPGRHDGSYVGSCVVVPRYSVVHRAGPCSESVIDVLAVVRGRSCESVSRHSRMCCGFAYRCVSRVTFRRTWTHIRSVMVCYPFFEMLVTVETPVLRSPMIEADRPHKATRVRLNSSWGYTIMLMVTLCHSSCMLRAHMGMAW